MSYQSKQLDLKEIPPHLLQPENQLRCPVAPVPPQVNGDGQQLPPAVNVAGGNDDKNEGAVAVPHIYDPDCDVPEFDFDDDDLDEGNVFIQMPIEPVVVLEDALRPSMPLGHIGSAPDQRVFDEFWIDN